MKRSSLYIGPLNEPNSKTTNIVAESHSDESDQPGHLPCLIGVFDVRTKKAYVLSRLGGCSD